MKNKKNDDFTIKLNPKIYSLSVIYGAAYVFIDKAYVVLDGDPKKSIEVWFRAKNIGDDLSAILGEFENELLNYALREQIVKSNQKIREYTIAQALLSSLGVACPDFQEKSGSSEEYVDDPLGIAKTWEDRFEKKSVKQKKCQCEK